MNESATGEPSSEIASEISEIDDSPLKLADEVEESFQGDASEMLDNLKSLPAQEAFIQLKNLFENLSTNTEKKSSMLKELEETINSYHKGETGLSDGAIEGIRVFLDWAKEK